MLIVSQNITNYDINLPNEVIFRINLAWINNLDILKEILEKHSQNNITLLRTVGVMFADIEKRVSNYVK